MAFFYLAPKWFYGYDIAMELLFGVITALVAFSSLRVYDLCQQKECKILGWSFIAISLSYFIWPLLNLFALSKIENGVNAVTLQNLSILSFIGVYSHMILFILGLGSLVYLGFGYKNQRLHGLIVSLGIIVVIFSERIGLAFNFVSALFLFYISLHYLDIYWKRKDKKTGLVLIAFILLFLARVVFVFATINHVLYVMDHLIELVAYALIALSLLKTLRVGRNGKKKK